jgi:hypothetical protein
MGLPLGVCDRRPITYVETKSCHSDEWQPIDTLEPNQLSDLSQVTDLSPPYRKRITGQEPHEVTEPETVGLRGVRIEFRVRMNMVLPVMTRPP